MSKLSIVVPCYNEEESIPLFYPAVEKVVRQMNDLQIEYWFVNDGSSDNSLVEMRKLHEQNPERVHYISFSRNFGKEAGLYAGLQAATGDYIVVMDVDLQDPPEFLPKMYELLQTGEYDCIGTRRVDRAGEAKFKSFLSTQFYHIINRLSQTNIVPGARDYRMMTRQMVDAVLSLKEYNRFSKGIFSWVGFKTKYLDYHNVERVAGKTDWSTWKLFKYAFDGIAFNCGVVGNDFICTFNYWPVVCYYSADCRTGQQCFWLGFNDLYYIAFRWLTAALYWHFRKIYRPYLSTSKAATNLYY